MELPQLQTFEAYRMNGNWNIQSKILKRNFSLLTDEDVKFEFGKESELLLRVENRLNIGRREALTILKSLQSEQS